MQQADTLLIRDLGASMCRAQGPAAAMAEGAKACSSSCPSVVFVGLAVLARDKQSLRYAVLLSSRRAAQQLSSVAASSAAAGIAIFTKQPVNVRDINTGDLGMEDLEYLRHVHSAQSYFAAPLVVSRNAQAALCVASGEPNAFAGHEDFLQVVAAMCAPYLALLTSTLPALEGLVKQVLPVRVALQLREAAAQQQQAQLPAALASPGCSGQAAAAAAEQAQGTSSCGAGSSAAAAATQQQRSQEDVSGVEGAADNSPWLEQPVRWQRQRQLRSRNPLLQQQLQQQMQAQPASPAMPQHLPLPGQGQQQQQQQTGLAAGSALGPLLTFRQPQLEHAYSVSACLRWQRRLDMMFLMLSLLSAVGGRLLSVSVATGSLAVAVSLLLVAGTVLWALLQQLLALPVPEYLRLRVPGIAAVRLLRVLLFCMEAVQLPAHVFVRPPAVAASVAGTVAGGAAGSMSLQQRLRWTPPEVAGCGVVVMQGLSGQLPLTWHAAVQAAAVAALFSSLSVLTVNKQGAAAAAPVYVAIVQLLVGWLVPVLAVALTERHMRMAFLHRIR